MPRTIRVDGSTAAGKPFSQGVAIAEIDIMRYVEIFRASGDSQLADDIEATIVTTAAQRQAGVRRARYTAHAVGEGPPAVAH